MRHSLAKAAALALIAPLAGGMLFAPPAHASPAKTAQADEPWSVFKVAVVAPAKVKAGGKITYRIAIENRGPEKADYFYLGGLLPKGITGRIHYKAREGTECGGEGRQIWCWTPYEMEKYDTEWLQVTVQLKKGTKGTATARLGAQSWNVPTGTADLSKEELDRIGDKFPVWFFAKTAKTKIVR
jgi:uncharacterized repeat protein (TIGR01451 family)